MRRKILVDLITRQTQKKKKVQISVNFVKINC